jgi:hypothetical protein
MPEWFTGSTQRLSSDGAGPPSRTTVRFRVRKDIFQYGVFFALLWTLRINATKPTNTTDEYAFSVDFPVDVR